MLKYSLEAGDEIVLHQLQRSETVRLEHDEQASGKIVQRRERRCDLVRVVREIVDHSDAVSLPAVSSRRLMPLKRSERLSGVFERRAALARGGKSGERVGDIVPARNLEPRLDRPRAAPRSLSSNAIPSGCGSEGGREKVSVRCRSRLYVTDFVTPTSAAVSALSRLSTAAFALATKAAEQQAQLLHRFVVERDVVQHRDASARTARSSRRSRRLR